MMTCACGSVVSDKHECTEKVQGQLVLRQCLDDCELCQKEVDRREYDACRWKVDEDDYTRCAECNEKLCGDICEVCFCSNCYEYKEDEECEICGK